jgi:hypothetical protein
LTSHSELGDAALREAGIAPTTIRISVGAEDPRSLLAHLIRASELAIELVASFIDFRRLSTRAAPSKFRTAQFERAGLPG